MCHVLCLVRVACETFSQQCTLHSETCYRANIETEITQFIVITTEKSNLFTRVVQVYICVVCIATHANNNPGTPRIS